jgi:addiction module HigA family antidote
MKKNGMRPVPPGEILNEDLLKPLGLTANALANAIGVPPNRITAILKDQRGITGDTAIRLGTVFKTSITGMGPPSDSLSKDSKRNRLYGESENSGEHNRARVVTATRTEQ